MNSLRGVMVLVLCVCGLCSHTCERLLNFTTNRLMANSRLDVGQFDLHSSFALDDNCRNHFGILMLHVSIRHEHF